MNFSWIILLVSIWAPVVYLLGAQWSAYDQYNYGWAVPFLCLILAAQKKTTDYGTTDYGPPTPAPCAVAASRESAADSALAAPQPSAGGPLSPAAPQPSAGGPAAPKPSVGGPTAAINSPPRSSLPPSPVVRSPVVRSPVFPRPVVLALLIAALLYWLMRVLQEANPIWRLASYGLALAAVAMTLLLIYLLHGRARLAQFAFPVAFFLVAVPWPTPLEGVAIQSLTRFNSSLVMELLGFAGIPALLHGNVIEISTGLVGIDEACSGIRSLQATLMIALFFGAFYRLPWARRGWLLVAGPALAMAFNLARTLTLVLVASHAGLPAMEKWHDPTGVALLLGCFFSLWAVALFLARGKGQGTQAKGQRSEVGGQKPEDKGQRPEVGSPISRRAEAQAEVGRSPLSSINSPLSAPCAVAASRESAADSALAAPKPSAGGPLSSPHPVVSSPVVSSPVVSSPVVSSLVFLYALTVALSTEAWFRSHEARGSQAVSWAAQWPTANASLQTNIIPPLALRELLCDQHASANWSDDTGVFWQAFYLRWLPADTFYGRARVAMSKGHNPAICLTGAGMTLQTRLEPVSLPVDPGLSLTFDRFVFTAGGRDLFVFFSQTEDLTDGGQANLRMTHLARLRAALTGSRNYGERNLEVALAGPASPAAALALFQARLPDLIEVKQP